MSDQNNKSMNLPWVEKYRPKQLDDLISHQDIISTSKEGVLNDYFFN